MNPWNSGELGFQQSTVKQRVSGVLVHSGIVPSVKWPQLLMDRTVPRGQGWAAASALSPGSCGHCHYKQKQQKCEKWSCQWSLLGFDFTWGKQIKFAIRFTKVPECWNPRQPWLDPSCGISFACWCEASFFFGFYPVVLFLMFQQHKDSDMDPELLCFQMVWKWSDWSNKLIFWLDFTGFCNKECKSQTTQRCWILFCAPGFFHAVWQLTESSAPNGREGVIHIQGQGKSHNSWPDRTER